jgi:hypothetical protein
MLVGQTLEQLPQRAQTRLIAGSGKAAGGRMFLPDEKYESRGNVIPATTPVIPAMNNLRLLVEDFLETPNFLIAFPKSNVISCIPPRGHILLHHMFGNIIFKKTINKSNDDLINAEK